MKAWEVELRRGPSDSAGSRLQAAVDKLDIKLDLRQMEDIYQAALSDHNSYVSNKGNHFERVVVKAFVEEELLPLLPEQPILRKQWLPHGTRRSDGGYDPLDWLIESQRLVVGVSPKFSGAAGDALTVWRQERERVKFAYPGRRSVLMAIKGNGEPFAAQFYQEDGIIPLQLANRDSVRETLLRIRHIISEARG